MTHEEFAAILFGGVGSKTSLMLDAKILASYADGRLKKWIPKNGSDIYITLDSPFDENDLMIILAYSFKTNSGICVLSEFFELYDLVPKNLDRNLTLWQERGGEIDSIKKVPLSQHEVLLNYVVEIKADYSHGNNFYISVD